MKYVIVSARETGKRASLMFCTLVLVASLTACGGGGVGVDALGDVVEAKKPISPNSQYAQPAQTAAPTTSVTETAPTNPPTYSEPVNSPTPVATTNPPTYIEPVSSTTQVATTTTTTAPPTVSTTPTGTYALAALGSPRILTSDAATLNRLRVMMASQTPAAMRFKGVVDAQLTGGNAWAFQPWHAALMGQISGGSAYCTYAVNETEKFVASEEALIAAGQPAKVAFDSYLYVGDRIGNLALVYDWCRAYMTGGQRARWIPYANQAVFNTWDRQHATWGGRSYATGAAGWAVNNPLNNYYYSFLRATMLLGLATYGENPQAAAWLDMFRITKIQNQLIPKFTSELIGGGSREGTGYGVAMHKLFELYDLWKTSTGENLADLTPHTKASLPWELHNIVPTLNRVSATGDHSRESFGALFDYDRGYIQLLTSLYPSEPLSGVAKTLLAQSSVPKMSSGANFYSDFLYDDIDIPALPLSTLNTAYWGSGTGQFMTRSSWGTDATYINLTAGPYTENHAHQDQGSFVLYKGNWLVFDANQVSKSGTAGTQTDAIGAALHNLVRVEQSGAIIKQTQGSTGEMTALADNQHYSYALAKTTPNYSGKPAVVRVEREFLFLKPGALIVFDRVQTTGTGIQRIFTLNLPQSPTVSGDNLTMINGASRLDVFRLAPAGLTTKLVSWPTVNPGFTSGVRVDVADAVGDNTAFLHVLGTDGAVLSAVRSDAAGQTGMQVALAGGRIATIRFSTAGSGGTIDIRNADGSVVTSGSLPTSVQAPPIYR